MEETGDFMQVRVDPNGLQDLWGLFRPELFLKKRAKKGVVWRVLGQNKRKQ